ncbi:hypothetical protein DM01DRAFT_1339902 [Hesseltinella vesiculosa]|uniref:Alkyl hydroperoxide reductase subunit C/ Thiol specific antioxidant domain-containing protein n=1 Tax=Hesseltinella vesiculosa TaxID=101127 RepID=A0A1X2G5L4_9FUNG|nr:hypothetical protein DM01DRAFT_1339902 [Hesseltinella vesiculosa]
MERFHKFQALPLVMSVDDETAHQAFLQHHQMSLPFPLLSDPTRSVTRYFNALDPSTGQAKRSVFVIDKFRHVKFSFIVADDRIVHSMDTIFCILHMLLPTPPTYISPRTHTF